MAESGPKKGLSFEVKGPIRSMNQWIDMSNRHVTLDDGIQISTCSPALGYTFAKGTTDGPGDFDLTQVGDWLGDLLTAPSMEQRDCQQPKQILLDTGEVLFWPFI